jgi:hypothetical protein
MTLGRRSWAEIRYSGKDISADLQPYLLDVSYTDNSGGQADELTVSLEDREGLWRDEWLPGAGDKLRCRLHLDDWGEGGGTLSCGEFTIDKPADMAGPPSTVKLSAVSVPTTSAARRTARSKAWEQVTLRTVADDVAASAGMTLVWEVDAAQEPGILDRVDQSSESDLAFLQKQCQAYRLAMKVTDSQIVIWDVTKFEQRDEFTTYTLGESRVKGWKLSVKGFMFTPKVKVEYHDPWEGVVQESTRTAAQELRGEDPNDPLGMLPQSFDDEAAETIRQRARSKAEAEAKAKAALLTRLEHTVEGSLTLMADVRAVAGNTIRLVGWKRCDGKYLISKAIFSGIGKEATVQVDIKRVSA